MTLNEIQNTVLETIKEKTAEERYLSIEDLETSLATKGTKIGRQELFTVLSSLRLDNRLDFTWSGEQYVYTIGNESEIEELV